jgi:hypothetical protein
MAVHWISAAYDLLAALLILIILNLYFDFLVSSDSSKIKYYFIIPILFFIALRTKEMAIVLPIILIVFHLVRDFNIYKSVSFHKLFRNVLLIILVIIMIFYGLLIITLPSQNVVVEENSPYRLDFSPVILGRNLLRYFTLYFNINDMSFSFQNIDVIYYYITLFFIIFLCFLSLTIFWKSNPLILTSLIGIVISLLPVLPMRNMQHRLYLYIPSIFFALLISSLFSMPRIKNGKIKKVAVLSICVFLILFVNFIEPVKTFKNYWMGIWENNSRSIQDINNINSPPKNTTIYINNVNQGANVFIYGPGYINNIIFKDKTVTTKVNPETDNYDPPYLIWDYNDGHILELERNMGDE